MACCNPQGVEMPVEVLEEIFLRFDPKTLAESVPKVWR
jgi:hypothetical protein